MDSRILSLLAFCLVFAACQEQIEVDLNTKDPRVVIEGNISDNGDPALVLVSQTTAFNDKTFFKGLPDALVTITDGAGKTDTLTAIDSGIYISTNITTQVGQTYRLKVDVGGKIYESVSIAPATVPIDSIYVTIGGFDNEERVSMDYRDIPGQVNFYKLDAWVNQRLRPNIEIDEDKFSDGQKRTENFGSLDDLKTGDTVDIYLRGIDKNVYEYFYTLDVNTSPASASPANPVSNITNGALGYFNACTVTHGRFIYP